MISQSSHTEPCKKSSKCTTKFSKNEIVWRDFCLLLTLTLILYLLRMLVLKAIMAPGRQGKQQLSPLSWATRQARIQGTKAPHRPEEDTDLLELCPRDGKSWSLSHADTHKCHSRHSSRRGLYSSLSTERRRYTGKWWLAVCSPHWTGTPWLQVEKNVTLHRSKSWTRYKYINKKTAINEGWLHIINWDYLQKCPEDGKWKEQEKAQALLLYSLFKPKTPESSFYADIVRQTECFPGANIMRRKLCLVLRRISFIKGEGCIQQEALCTRAKRTKRLCRTFIFQVWYVCRGLSFAH